MSIQELTEAVERLEKEVADLKAENAKLRATVVHEHHVHHHNHYDYYPQPVIQPQPLPANPWWQPMISGVYPLTVGVAAPSVRTEELSAIYVDDTGR